MLGNPKDREDKDLPGVGRSLRRALVFGFHAERALLMISLVLAVTSFIPEALAALWLKVLIDAVASGNDGRVAFAAGGLAMSAVGGWLLGAVAGHLRTRFTQRAAVALEAHVARLQASVGSLEHHERPQYLDRLQILKDHAFLLNHLYPSAFSTFGSAIRLLLTVGLLVSVHPVLALLAGAAIPTVLVASWRAKKERAAEEGAAEHDRLTRHLFEVATTAGSAKEVRVTRSGDNLRQRRTVAWESWYSIVGHTRWRSAIWRAATWTLFGLAYTGAVIFVTTVAGSSPGQVLLVLAAGAALTRYISVTVGEAEFLRWTLDAATRFVWLEDYAAASSSSTAAPVPGFLADGIRFDDVSFKYPGTDEWVLRDVDLTFKAGAVVALVGENGAGKSTLVKLLCRYYEPTEGRVLVDGVNLADVPSAEWRKAVAGAFQDFYRFELLARKTIGLGDLPRRDDEPAILRAVERADAGPVVERLRAGLSTQLGPTWEGGVELSFGQWQRLALARGLMRDSPLLLVLDEPTAALDAETEHALFESFAAAARSAADTGRVTVLVSHRFSTVRMADLIVVVDGGRIVETGTHDDLVAKGGAYADLYALQAASYK